MITFAHDGNNILSGTWSAITSARSLNADLLNIPKDATHWIRYTTGSVADLIVGETLTGGTSSKTCVVVSFIKEQGAFGTTNTSGTLFVKDVSGAFQAETLTGGTSSGTVAIQQDLVQLQQKGEPKALLISVETQDVLVTTSGISPAITQDYGVLIQAGYNRVFRGKSNIKNFKAINATASNGAVLKYELYF